MRENSNEMSANDDGYREYCLSNKPSQCVVCGEDQELVVHHVDGDRTNNELENLVPMCEQCHRDVHDCKPRVESWVEKLGFRVREGEKTSIEVTSDTWRRLNRRKDPGETFDEVLADLLEAE